VNGSSWQTTCNAQGAYEVGKCAALHHVAVCAGDAQSWRLLGAAHAENDNDSQAIAAALRALDAAPNNADVLLALGISHVNELQEGEAVGYLLR
jgi:Flp pilus assembly protein TadD